jgi:type I restriction enzyme S subunit
MSNGHLPRGWSIVPLSELRATGDYTFVGGPFGSDLTSADYIAEPGVPVIRGTNLGGKESRFVDEGFVYVSDKKANLLLRNCAYPGDVVFTQRGTLGQVAVIPSSARFERYVISQSQMKLTPDSSKVDSRFLYYYFRSPKTLDRLLSETQATGVPHINLGILKRFPVTVPPLAQQRRIAAVLDRAEALRAKRRAALAELDSLTQSLFLDLFGDPTSQTQSLPIQPLESLLAQPLQNGAYYPKENYTQVGGVEMVHMSDAFYEIVPRGNLKRVLCSESDIQKYALTENDILIARRSLTLEGAAKPCLIPKSNEPLIFESSFIRVTPQPGKITALYLYHYLGNERVKQKCVQPFITQSTISGINQSNLERVPVIVPPLALQHKFARQVTAVENLKAAHRASLAELDALFATLQHRAFRGEL